MLRQIVDIVHGNCFGITIPDVAWVAGNLDYVEYALGQVDCELSPVFSGLGGLWIFFSMFWVRQILDYFQYAILWIRQIICSMVEVRHIVDYFQYALVPLDCG